MYDLPVMLSVRGRRCVIVGGGSVATRRADSLLSSGAVVKAVAPRFTDTMEAMAIERVRRPYRRGDLEDAFLAVIATDDRAVNQAAAEDAAEDGALVNRGDEAAAGDLSIPAHARHGCLTLAVHTAGVSATAAGRIRRELSAALDPDWARLLDLVAPFRERIRRSVEDGGDRRQRLASLVGEEAMQTLKEQGPSALTDYCRRLSR